LLDTQYFTWQIQITTLTGSILCQATRHPVMKRILPWLAICLVTVTGFTGETASAPVFQLRLVLDESSTNSELLLPVSPRDPAAPQLKALNVERKVLLDQAALKSAVVTKDHLGHPQIDLQFNQAGGQRFAEITKTNIHKRLAIVVDGQLYSAPVVNSEITGGQAVISGSFTLEEANALAGRITGKLKK